MPNQKLEIRAGLKIMRPPGEVFEAIVDPSKMSNYFIESSTGKMEEGKTVTWKFPEFDMKFPVRMDRIEKDKYISFYWDGAMDKKETIVEINLTPFEGKGTFVVITEKEKDNDEAGIKWLKSNTEGWANFLACLKAFLEYGINLRKNSFDSSQLPTKDITV
jgi:uncharacterized protein YndB with AHSA1/START domain